MASLVIAHPLPGSSAPTLRHTSSCSAFFGLPYGRALCLQRRARKSDGSSVHSATVASLSSFALQHVEGTCRRLRSPSRRATFCSQFSQVVLRADVLLLHHAIGRLDAIDLRRLLDNDAFAEACSLRYCTAFSSRALALRARPVLAGHQLDAGLPDHFAFVVGPRAATLASA